MLQNYKGAGFLKCDLHMQTPVEPHWRDSASSGSYESSKERLEEIAKQFLQRCHEVQLDVVGITDHNFAPTAELSFIHHLRAHNDVVAKQVGRSPLTILPGFEIEVTFGKGCHCIALFPQDTPLHVVDSRLSALDLPTDRRFQKTEPRTSPVSLEKLLHVVQGADSYAGVIIAAHVLNEKGLLNDDFSALLLQQEAFCNTDLLCVEVPKPIEQLSKGLQRLFQSGPDCAPHWRRERPIACIQSSDCYRLTPNKVDEANYIGYRYCWIKMSQPDIESLRQAFLDHESRIRLQPSCPDDQLVTRDAITRVAVDGASFYNADPVWLSPQLNCVIGGRGSGKSTLLDYVRVALDAARETDLPRRTHEELWGRMKSTLVAGSVEVDIQKGGIPYRVTYHRGAGTESRLVTRLDGAEAVGTLSDVRTLFPIRALSQREIDGRVEPGGSALLLQSLDSFIHDHLAQLQQRNNELLSAIRAGREQMKAPLSTITGRHITATKIADCEARLRRIEAIRLPLEKWNQVEHADASIRTSVQSYELILSTIASSFGQEEPSQELAQAAATVSDDGLSAALLPLRQSLESAWIEFRTVVMTASQAFRKAVTAGGPIAEQLNAWDQWVDAERRTYEGVLSGLEEGLDAIEGLRLELRTAQETMASIEVAEHQLEAMKKDERQLVSELQVLWRKETEARQGKAHDLMRRLTMEGSEVPLVEILIEHQGDLDSTCSEWSNHIRDHRRLSDTDIRAILEPLQKAVPTGMGLSQYAVDTVRDATRRTEMLKVLTPRAAAAFDVAFSQSVIEELELYRAPDGIKINVYRRDGTLSGSIDRVSVGQQGLAFLNVMLAEGTMPLIVDTPEEGLDNEGVYRDLVPLFRRAKGERQIIVVTHNANIPVNGDAELICPLEAVGVVDEVELAARLREFGLSKEDIGTLVQCSNHPNWQQQVADYLGGLNMSKAEAARIVLATAEIRTAKGTLRKWASSLGGTVGDCSGALDRQSTKVAVQDIMEGSEEAFRRRWEMYGF